MIIYEPDPLPPSSRLLVVLPDRYEYLNVGYRINKLAHKQVPRVLFIQVVNPYEIEYLKETRLHAVAAVTRDWMLKVDICLEYHVSRVKAVQQHFEPGDLVGCFQAQTITRPLLLGKQPLYQAIAKKLGDATPLYLLE